MGKTRELLFKGTIKGTAVSDERHGLGELGAIFNFSIEMDDRIEGIPLKIPVCCWPPTIGDIIFCIKVHKGDKVLVHGKIIKQKLKFWQKEVVYMKASHIYNETEDFGF